MQSFDDLYLAFKTSSFYNELFSFKNNYNIHSGIKNLIQD